MKTLFINWTFLYSKPSKLKQKKGLKYFPSRVMNLEFISFTFWIKSQKHKILFYCIFIWDAIVHLAHLDQNERNPSALAVPKVKQLQLVLKSFKVFIHANVSCGPVLIFFDLRIMMIISTFCVRYTLALQILCKHSRLGRKMHGETFAAIRSPGLLDPL